MPGMNSGLNSNNTTMVAAFRNALLHQGIIVLLVFALLAVAWVAVRVGLTPKSSISAIRTGWARARITVGSVMLIPSS